MPKVVITIGDTPADCSLEIDSVKVENVVSVKASIDIDTGPAVTYSLHTQGVEEQKDVAFNAVVDQRGTPIEVKKDGSIIVKGQKDE